MACDGAGLMRSQVYRWRGNISDPNRVSLASLKRTPDPDRHVLGVSPGLEPGRLTVSTRLPSDALDPPTWDIIRHFALNPHALALWVPPLALAVLLRVITVRWKHQLLFPICAFRVPVILSNPLELAYCRFPNHSDRLLCRRRGLAARPRHAPTRGMVVRNRSGGRKYGYLVYLLHLLRWVSSFVETVEMLNAASGLPQKTGARCNGHLSGRRCLRSSHCASFCG